MSFTRKSSGQKTLMPGEDELVLSSPIGALVVSVDMGDLGRKKVMKLRLVGDVSEPLFAFMFSSALFPPYSQVCRGCPPRPCTRRMLRHVSHMNLGTASAEMES